MPVEVYIGEYMHENIFQCHATQSEGTDIRLLPQSCDAGLVTLIHIPTWSQGVSELPLVIYCLCTSVNHISTIQLDL